VRIKKVRIKKFVVFMLVILAVYGFTAVDNAYSDMMDQDGQVRLQVRRINSEYISLSIFGKSKSVNTKELAEDWNGFSQKVVGGLEVATESIRGALGVEEPEMDYSVFHTQIL